MTRGSVSARIQELKTKVMELSPETMLTEGAEMSRLTTLRLGGPADLLAEPCNVDGLQTLLRESSRLELPVTLIGRGSDLLVRDGGIRGLVIRLAGRFRGMTVTGQRMTVLAGTSMSAAANEAAAHDLAGLAFASGIPGTVGGGAYMNAGAYGGEMRQVIARVDCFDMQGNPVSFSREKLNFGHRHSVLQERPVAAHTIHFELTPGDGAALRQEMAELNRRRAEKQPLNYPSAGSTFKRPEGNYASALIDQCGLKGCTIGGAQVSEKHAGFLLNRGGTAADFLALMAHVQQVVRTQTGVQLEPEVCILGEDAPAVHL